MGSTYCPNCKQSVSDAIDECPRCGTTLSKNMASAVMLQDRIGLGASQSLQPPFFAVSLLKLAVLSTCTAGMYEIYWFWRQWNRIRVNGEPTITPSLRAFFLIFYCYPCFIRIKLAGVSRGIIPAPHIGALAICYILASISWKLPGALGLIVFLKVIFLLPIQSYVNRVNAAALPGHDPNSRFSVLNWITTAVGGTLFILAVIGNLLPNR